MTAACTCGSSQAAADRSTRRRQRGPVAAFTILVTGTEHGRGIGTLLLEDLVRQARADGIRELASEVLVANAPMLRAARDLYRSRAAQMHQLRTM